MNDAYVRDSHLSTHDDPTVENSYTSEDQASPVTHSQMKKNVTKDNTNQKMKIGLC